MDIDGYFLKNKCRSQLLSIAGIDANDYIYPIAYIVVKTKSIDYLT